ncbi:hypothetical protein AMTR_s00029p00212590 [Amborella trichopoda]|uniref:K+ potassium transporter integral membrane domain-containing protein n=1 Tax=Amborella trichopoda TaxID=13333 RepID=W1PPQ4_AMBTC|nr:hypothetical protein AMTR_s00029p00212590 [Amborella trichopoda]
MDISSDLPQECVSNSFGIEKRDETSPSNETYLQNTCETSTFASESHSEEFYPKIELKETLILAYQTIGVAYGDLGTSSLYVCLPTGIQNPSEDDILGTLSLIFWGLTFIGLLKYALIAVYAHDHGEDGTFALYSLLNHHLGHNMVNNDLNLSRLSQAVKNLLKNSAIAQNMVTHITDFHAHWGCHLNPCTIW